MAVIPNSNEKIQEESLRTGSAVAEDALTRVGAAVNYLLDQVPLLDDKTLKTQVFLSNGTFTVPADVTTVILEGCGGGGAGSGVNFTSASVGGNGAAKCIAIVNVTPGDNITVTIGAGGTCPNSTSRGGDGGNTTFGAFATFRGAAGGNSLRQDQRSPENGEAVGGGFQWFNNAGSVVRISGQGSQYGFNAGSDNILQILPTPRFGYGGGAGPYGNGGNGGSEIPVVAPTAGGVNTGAGGGGGNFSLMGGVGASGGSGRLIIAYVSKF